MIKKNVILFEGTLKEFLETITHERKGYFKKYRAHNVTKVWWEEDEDWFLNVAIGKMKTNKYEKSIWVLRPDAEKSMDFHYIRKGYVMYIEKEDLNGE